MRTLLVFLIGLSTCGCLTEFPTRCENCGDAGQPDAQTADATTDSDSSIGGAGGQGGEGGGGNGGNLGDAAPDARPDAQPADGMPPADAAGGAGGEPDMGTTCIPAPEACDGQDNNCDGQTDEAFPFIDLPCNLGEGNCLTQGTFQCSPDGNGTICADAPPPPAGCDEPICANGQMRAQPCGLNSRGQQIQTCQGEMWGPFEACTDPDICIDNTPQSQPCGLNGAGTQSRTCTLGQWPADFGVCQDDDVCSNGSTEEEMCGRNGMRQRSCAAGQWGQWSECAENSECEDGQLDMRGCGLNSNGEQTRFCEDGHWGDFGICEDPDVCVNGSREQQVCGLNNRGQQERSCGAGQWSDFNACEDPDVCRDGTTEDSPCGLNNRGTHSHLCANGQWGEFGACEDPDVCVDRAEQPCGPDAVGICRRGTEICQNGHWNACQGAVFPAEDETCNGLDDDCDGDTDEEALQVGDGCNTGRPGICARGTFRCMGAELECVSDKPGGDPEVCDGADNNCDGRIDEGCANTCNVGAQRPCDTALLGVCRNGTQTCVDAMWGACTPNIRPNMNPEVCDSTDNNCDGRVDEGLGLGEPCTTGEGACEAVGVTRCGLNPADPVVCDAQAGGAGVETCNNVDDDCDGETDEDFGLGDPCTVGQGICQRAGTNQCTPEGNVTCSAAAGEPNAETCANMGTDDDCNGSVDDIPTLGDACVVELGMCRAEGTLICGGDGQLQCSAQAPVATPEVCDNLDNDCDGAIDNGVQNACGGCGAVPSEVCDGLDNNCDGRIDEGADLLPRIPCQVLDGEGNPLLGVCLPGRTLCEAGRAMVCEAYTTAAGQEPCNDGAAARDDNCNGMINEGCGCNPGERQACYHGPPGTMNRGACRSGLALCSGQRQLGQCEGEVLPTPEVAGNAIDEDCNGAVAP